MGAWTSFEWERIVRLRAEGMTIPAVAARIGRSVNATTSKIRWEEMTADQRKARAARIKTYKATHRATIRTTRHYEVIRTEQRPSEALLHDREMRHAAGPRDLTGAFFGDPPRGYSALERRA